MINDKPTRAQKLAIKIRTKLTGKNVYYFCMRCDAYMESSYLENFPAMELRLGSCKPCQTQLNQRIEAIHGQGT